MLFEGGTHISFASTLYEQFPKHINLNIFPKETKYFNMQYLYIYYFIVLIFITSVGIFFHFYYGKRFQGTFSK